jgi:anti-sigma factor RsiW
MSAERAAGAPPLSCREFVEYLYDYLLGTLPPECTARFNEHLAACPSCVAYMKTYEASIRMGRSALSPSDDRVPADVPEELIQAILAAR